MAIPEPNFYLKNILSKEPTLIYFQSKYSYNGFHRVMISTGDKILPAEWDPVKKRAIAGKKNPANADINTWLDKIASTCKSEYRSCLIDGIACTSPFIPTAEKYNLIRFPRITKN